MKTRLLTVVFVLLLSIMNISASPRAAEWKQVNEAIAQGLPKTAIEKLGTILTASLAENAYGEATRAMARKIALEGEIQGGKAEEKIAKLQAEIEKAPAPMKPAMEAILAHWYWQYYQQNRWRFLQRTQTASTPGKDFQTWDLPRILSEIDRHFSAALANDSMLKATPIDEFDGLLERGNVPDQYRPTWFDFLVYDALAFFAAGEQGSTASEDNFEISASSPILGKATDFLNWHPESADRGDPKIKAIALYQALLGFHQSDDDPSAFADADLARIAFAHNIVTGDEDNKYYKAALERFIEVYSAHEISARAIAALAEQIQSEGDSVQARALAVRGHERFPHSVGGTSCLNLISQIETKSAQITTERVWNAPWPTLNVTYRNVTKVYFRAQPLDFKDYLEEKRGRSNALDYDELTDLLGNPPALAWSADLSPTQDYKDHTENLPVPTALKAGFYIIIASHDPTFSRIDNQLSLTPIWVSQLALVTRTQTEQTGPGGFVLNAISGEPVAGATVRIWTRRRGRDLVEVTPTKTDRNGQFQLSLKDGSAALLAEKDGQSVATDGDFYYYNNPIERDNEDSQTVFFTDRALYRPGQTINYKGVSIRYRQSAGKYAALDGKKLSIVFKDVNGRELARTEQVTNDYGSFSGVFTAPRDGLMGRMSIEVLGRPSRCSFNVEEYKRPKFQTRLNPPAEAAKLEAVVNITGNAEAYTGAAIGDARVKWRVERSVQLPSWCWWWQPPSVKAIAHGTAVTAADGTFRFEFPAEPDRTVPVKNEPIFAYNLHVDVTDTTGETRSDDRTVLAGYTALQASIKADEWQTEDKSVKFAIATHSLGGDPQSAEGHLKIYSLKQPAMVQRAPLANQRDRWWRLANDEPALDPTNSDSWELGPVVAERTFKTDGAGAQSVKAELKTGIYRALLETKDRFGKAVSARQTFQVVNPDAKRFSVKLPNVVLSPNWSVEPGEKFTALWATGYDQGRAYIEIACDGKLLENYWTAPDRTQTLIQQKVTEEMRGGFTVRITYVRENRAYIEERAVDVPWSNKELTLKWESFRSKLEPGQKETWTAVVTGPKATRTAAEMVATLYDGSLDQYLPHSWPRAFDVFRHEYTHSNSVLQNDVTSFAEETHWDVSPQRIPNWRYRSFASEVLVGGYDDEAIVFSPFVVQSSSDQGYRANETLAGTRIRTELRDVGGMAKKSSTLAQPAPMSPPSQHAAAIQPDLSKISARKNLNETAFFFPLLTTDADGVVKMTFTMPEALTEWKFFGFAHDKQLRSGFLNGTTVTSKDLMVEPNAPRFVREGDAIEFTVKVSNQSESAQRGTVKLSFAEAASLKNVDGALGNNATEQSFELPAKQSRSFSWRIAVPDGMDFLTYKAVAASDKFSDGEEGFLPVLSRRVLVTESLPMPIRGRTTKQFEFTKLLASSSSKTLIQQSLTVQMVSHPAWYAVMALPYLMEYPYECSEQVFNRFYANALAQHIAQADPKIRRVFDLWKNTAAPDSPLEKNQDLKSVRIEETPWLREAANESQARRNVGLLFDQNRLHDESSRALKTLADRQLDDGLWAWFPGGRSSEYISLYITAGFGRLRHLGVEIDPAAAIKSLAGLDSAMTIRYKEILRHPKPEEYRVGSADALYLYGRSFYLKDQPIAAENQPAIDFFLTQARKSWLQLNSRQSQAQLALALQRFGEKETPLAIMKSLKERSVSDEELGMFWRDSDASWWWYEAPIETQAMMIEAFAEVTHDEKAVQDCQVWLLKQKQTQNWKTTKATADAIYGLLLRGTDLLSSDENVEVSLAGNPLKPDKVEAGTGFFERKFIRDEIKPAMGQVTVKKNDDGISWGSVHWQYLEDVAKVIPHEGTPLQLKKSLYIKENTVKGQVLKPVTGPVAVGDELVVRIELRTDRAMEFIHLKDQRGSGTEPVDVVSQYKYQDGLGYYQSTRDTATHFFIESLPRGVYVFEYSVRVQLKGKYQSGLAEIQCMYAPEFNSHSESSELEVK